jgi:hypothetical protein
MGCGLPTARVELGASGGNGSRETVQARRVREIYFAGIPLLRECGGDDGSIFRSEFCFVKTIHSHVNKQNRDTTKADKH